MEQTSTVRVSSDNQSMWRSGPAQTIDWVEYVPIIGGDITLFTLENAKVTVGQGKVTINDGRIKYDSEGLYDDLAKDAETTVTIAFDAVDESGNSTSYTTEIGVIGGASEPIFTHKDSGYEGAGTLTFTALTAATLLQDVHQFEQVVPLDIGFDAAESLADGIAAARASLQAEVDRNQANLDEALSELATLEAARDVAANKVGHITTVTSADADIAARIVILEAAYLSVDALQGLQYLYQAAEVEKNLAIAARTGASVSFDIAQAGVDAAELAVDAAETGVDIASSGVTFAESALSVASDAVKLTENALNAAKNGLAAAVGVLEDAVDALGSFLGEAAYIAQIGLLYATNIFGVNNGAIAALEQDRADYLKAKADQERLEGDVEKFSDTLKAEKVDLSEAETALTSAQSELASAKRTLESTKTDLDSARDDLDGERLNLSRAEAAANTAIDNAARALNAYITEGGDTALSALEKEARNAEVARDTAYENKASALAAMRADGFFLDRDPNLADLADATLELTGRQALVTTKDIEIFGTEGYAAILDASQAAFDTVTDSNISANVEVAVDSYAQAGILIDFALDGGSVDTDIDFKLTSDAVYNQTLDTFTIAPTVTNATTGESIAFTTASPNITFFAGLAYSAGATFNILADVYARLLGIDILDFPTGTEPATYVETVSIDGIVPLIDFDSREFGLEFSPPGFLGDIISFEFNSPSIETEGREAAFDPGLYEDVTGTSLEQIAEVILDLLDLRLEYSEEFQKILADNGASTEVFGSDLATAVTNALEGILDSLSDEYDLDGDGFVPILVVEQRSDGSLLHINSISDDLAGLDDPNKGKFGFFIADGSSDNIFQVNLDVDQLIATVINVALGNTPESTINPLDLSLNIYDLFETDTSDDPDASSGIEKLKEYFNLDFGFELADLDVRTGVGFRQDFALSIDDVGYQVAFEDGTTGSFSANDADEIVFANASDLTDTNGNGQIDYTLSFTPTAEFFNDTEVALNVGYTLDLIKAKLDLAANLPFVDLGYEANFSFGPILRLDGEVDLLSLDIFEDRFAFNAGTGEVAGSFASLPNEVVGSDANDTLLGSTGNDVLDGGSGDDMLNGGLGDDVYIIDGRNDRVVEAPGEGVDVVRATAEVSLGDAEIEQVILEGSRGLRVNGNEFATEIIGNSGSNILIGGGGGDTITGGGGTDFFAFLTTDAEGPTLITDFSGSDQIALDDRFFGLGDSSINVRDVTQQQVNNALNSGAATYNRKTGELHIDQDGRRGPEDAELILTIEGGGLVSADDFLLF